MEKNNSKQIVLSILAVVVLVIAVVGVSFAMYTFSGTGTKENTINTATLSITYSEETYINLTNQFPQADSRGFALDRETPASSTATAGAVLEFSVQLATSIPTTVNYDVNFDAVVNGTTLTTDYIKLYVTTVSGATETPYTGFGTTGSPTAKLMNLYYDVDPAVDLPIIEGTFSAEGTHTYVIRAWVSDAYDLPTTDNTSGATIGNTTTTDTITFKLKVSATD